MRRQILGTAAGLATAFVVVAAGEAIGHMLFPPPPGVDLTKPDQLSTLMAKLPAAAVVAILVAWAAGSFAGGAVAAWTTRRRLPALLVGLAMLVAGGWTMLMIPHPAWFVAVSLPAAVLPAWLAGRRFANVS